MKKVNASRKSIMSRMNKTRKLRGLNQQGKTRQFEKEITMKFLEMILMIKLWHWKTYSYATHKATDELYSKFNENMDQFIEVLLGKTNTRIDLTKVKKLTLLDFKSVETFKEKINSFKSYLVHLENAPFMKLMSNTDLLNIRDEILSNLNQFLYLLTLK